MYVLAQSTLDPLASGIAAILGAVTGSVLTWFLFRALTGNTIKRAGKEAERIMQTAQAEADAEGQRIQLEAEKKAAKRREEVDGEIAAALADVKKDQARIAKREDTLDQKLEKRLGLGRVIFGMRLVRPLR